MCDIYWTVCQSLCACVRVSVPCPYGRAYDATLDRCVICPVGQYQDEAGSTSCKVCPLFTTTYGEGATSMDECVGKCHLQVLLCMITSGCFEYF